MPSNAAKCFSNGPKKFKSSQDYTNKRKAKSIYQGAQNSSQINDGQILIDTTGCLGAVGGYDTKNYDLLLNITKGKYLYDTYFLKKGI